MVEIYSYDITTHERFAHDQQQAEAFRKQYHITPSGARQVAVHTTVLDFIPKHPAVVLLMQTYQRKMWANFSIPKNYYLQRFASSYVAPSLGSKEKQNADINRLEAFIKKRTQSRTSPELLREGETLINLLEKGVKETNDMIDYVIARMHQFIQA